MKITLRKVLFGTLFILIGLILVGGWLIAQPGCHRNAPLPVVADPVLLRSHVDLLSVDLIPRSSHNVENLKRCAQAITDRMQAPQIRQEPFTVKGGAIYHNVIASFAPGTTPRIIVGAHYDAYTVYPGADDNASGVAGLIELSRLLSTLEDPPPVDLVAYPLEEPPYFATDEMGSAFHARSVSGSPEDIRGVIVLEMIGYFTDEPHSQTYPLPILKTMYPSTGNFIALASRFDQGDWVKEVKDAMQGVTEMPVHSIVAPAGLPGIDFSDHRNYWEHGIQALMITDTAFYRNENYHTPEDTADTLDYERMAQVVTSVFHALQTIHAATDSP